MPKKTRSEVIADLMETVQQKNHTDSKEFREILYALNTVNSLGKKKVMVTTRTMQKLKPDELSKLTVADRDEVGFKEFAEAQQALIKACDEYLGAKKVRFSISGRKRAKAVQALRDMAASESYRDADIVRLEKEGKTWDAVHATARTVVKDASELEKAGSAGAATSERGVLSDGYFTAEQMSMTADSDEQLTRYQDYSHFPGAPKESGSASKALEDKYRKATVEMFKYYPAGIPLESIRSKKIAVALEEGLRSQGLPIDEANKSFLYARAKTWQKLYTARGKHQEAGIAAGSNMTNRSIATSRMATLLGMDALVAKTVPVEFRSGSEVTKKGILMETVSGIDTGRPESVGEAVYGATSVDTSSYEFTRQSIALHIMDIISGQIDRHGANVIYQSHKDPITGALVVDGIKAIDHDLSFGESLMQTYIIGIKVVDKETKEAVDSVTHEMVDYMFKDVLEPKAIDAIKKRLDAVKDKLSKVPVVESAADYAKLSPFDQDDTAARYYRNISQVCGAAFPSVQRFNAYSGMDFMKCIGKGPLGEKEPDMKKLSDAMSAVTMKESRSKSPVTFHDLFVMHAAYAIHMKHIAAGDTTPMKEIMANPSPEDKAILTASAQELLQLGGDKKKTEEYLKQSLKGFFHANDEFGFEQGLFHELLVDYAELVEEGNKEYSVEKAKATEEANKAKEAPEVKAPEAKTEAKEVQAEEPKAKEEAPKAEEPEAKEEAPKAKEEAPKAKAVEAMSLSEVEAEVKEEKKAEEKKAKEEKAEEKKAEEKTEGTPYREPADDIKAELGIALAKKVDKVQKDKRMVKGKDGKSIVVDIGLDRF